MNKQEKKALRKAMILARTYINQQRTCVRCDVTMDPRFVAQDFQKIHDIIKDLLKNSNPNVPNLSK